MAIFKSIDILAIANKCGVSGYYNTFDLKDEFEKILKTPKYLIGFLKYRDQIEDIKRAISMLEEKEQIGYRIVQNSPYFKKEVSVLLDTNEELNLFIQLNRITEADACLITDETCESVINELIILSEENGMSVGFYFLMYLYYLEYIELDMEQVEKVYSEIKYLADSEYYLNRNYKKIAKRLDGVHGAYNNLCYYALKLPLFISIYEYKRRDKEKSFQYLTRMLQVARDYEIRYEERLISLLEETYIYYEITRRIAYGEGTEKNVKKACYMVESILDNFSYINKDEIMQGYIFENPSKKQIQAEELKSLLYELLSYTCYHKEDNGENSKNKESYIEDLNREKESKSMVVIKTDRNWNRVNLLVEELDSMQGLTSVKRKVHEIIDGIKVAEYKKEQFGDESDSFGTMHLIFTGNAGTGKTTVARILGKIYGALGILVNEDLFVECGRVDLVGEHIGSTAPKVKKMVESALGGILFIDEAYSLTDHGGDIFGAEAVNTLLAEVENHRKDLIVILAGYQDKMHEFLKSNQGLSSRFCTEIYFEDYSPKDMVEIIKKMAADRPKAMFFKPEVENYLFEFFRKKTADKDLDFGNARGVRNEFEFISMQKSTRIAEIMKKGEKPGRDDIYVFQLEDVLRCPECGTLMNMRNGKYGKFMSCKNYKCKNTVSVEKYFKKVNGN